MIDGIIIICGKRHRRINHEITPYLSAFRLDRAGSRRGCLRWGNGIAADLSAAHANTFAPSLDDACDAHSATAY